MPVEELAKLGRTDAEVMKLLCDTFEEEPKFIEVLTRIGDLVAEKMEAQKEKGCY